MDETQKRNGKTVLKMIGFITSVIFIVIFISVLLGEFEEGVRKEERESVVLAMAEMSDQGAAMVEERVDASMRNIEYIARLLVDEDDIQDEEVINSLNRILLEQDTGISRFGVAIPDGTSKVSNGESVNVSDREFFQKSMQGQNYVSGSTESKILDKEVFFLSSPIYDEQNKIKGVLYGSVETENFKIYNNEELAERDKNQYIVDSEGEYISKFLSRKAILSQKNLFDDLKEKKSSVPVEEIKQYMKEEVSTYTEIGKGNERAYVYITPIDINEWYVVTVVDERLITDRVSHLQSHAVRLIGSLTIIMLFFMAGYFAVISLEKRKAVEMNQELRIRDSIFQIATAEMDGFVFLYDAPKDQIDFMKDCEIKLGVPKSIKQVSQGLAEAVSDENKAVVKELVEAMQRELEEHREKSKYNLKIRKKQEDVYYEVNVTHLYDKKNRPVRSIGIIYDVTDKRKQEIRLEREEKLRILFMMDTIAFYEINVSQDKVLKENNIPLEIQDSYRNAFDNFLKKRVEEKYKGKMQEQCSLEHMKQCFGEMQRDYTVEYEYIRDDGLPYWVATDVHLGEEEGEIIAFLTIRDIDSKKRRELHLEQTAVYDALTQVYNRSAGVQKVNQALEVMMPGESSAFLILDLDGFKQLNDSLGHITGDQALVEVADILKNHFRSYDVVCRLGGDEFIAFIKGLPVEALDKVVGSLLKKLTLTYGEGEKQITISASVGIAFAPEHGMSFQQLYEKADKALYMVKKSTKNGYKVYQE